MRWFKKGRKQHALGSLQGLGSAILKCSILFKKKIFELLVWRRCRIVETRLWRAQHSGICMNLTPDPRRWKNSTCTAQYMRVKPFQWNESPFSRPARIVISVSSFWMGSLATAHVYKFDRCWSNNLETIADFFKTHFYEYYAPSLTFRIFKPFLTHKTQSARVTRRHVRQHLWGTCLCDDLGWDPSADSDVSEQLYFNMRFNNVNILNRHLVQLLHGSQIS